MTIIKKFLIFESAQAEKMIEEFEKKYDTELDSDFNVSQIKLIKKAFELFEPSFIKGKITKIKLGELGGVHGRWHDSKKKKEMTLNPSIFSFKKEFENGSNDLPYKLFILVHEIGHCIDHIEKGSFSKTWQAISGWKRLDRNKKTPDGYERYVERRPGREIAGPKKSNWIHKDDANFIRRYTSRNPREDFADCFAFGVFGHWHRFKGEDGEKKMRIIKELLKRID